MRQMGSFFQHRDLPLLLKAPPGLSLRRSRFGFDIAIFTSISRSGRVKKATAGRDRRSRDGKGGVRRRECNGQPRHTALPTRLERPLDSASAPEERGFLTTELSLLTTTSIRQARPVAARLIS